VAARQYQWFAGMLIGAFATVLVFSQVPQPRVATQDCASCHRDIAETYRRTGMGRSFSRPSEAGEGVYYHAPSNSYFTMLRRDGKLYQRRHQLDAGGQQINVMEKQVDYVMGSGNHARTYLHRTAADTLIELPLGWYAEKGGYWAMNPGYDRPDHEGFRRPITYDCMFCHNAYPKIPTKSSEPVYSGALPEGIDCQRCHGDGSRHAQLAGTRGAKPETIRAAIVNPARLSAERQMETCMACHLESTSFSLPNALTRHGRGPFSFRPGEPLADFILNFDHARGTGREDKFEIVSSAYGLRRSECFLKSKMTCTTCHNPHDVPRGEAAVQHYNAVCRGCHQQVTADNHTKTADCVSCHMPKRRTEDVIHVAVTDHYIQRRKPEGDLLAERTERRDNYRGPVVPYYPATLAHTAENDLLLAVAQVKQSSNLKAGIVQLTAAIEKYRPASAEWYLELAEALDKDRQLAKALPLYREAARRRPDSAAGLQKLGTALRRSALSAESEAVLKRATVLSPRTALTWHELGLTYRSLQRTTDAVAALSKALEHDPEMPEAHNNLGIIWLTAADQARAETAFREAIRIRPDYADAHGNLANLLAQAGKFNEARAEFEVSLRLRPDDAPTRYNYALLLGRTNLYDEAQRQLEAALRADPDFADAHELLGDLLMARTQAREAAPHYREALRIRPESGRANLGLGAALLALGNSSESVPYLQKAAASPDVGSRQRAAEILRQLR
jgi:predicted CXXCH cytochrome family protein